MSTSLEKPGGSLWLKRPHDDLIDSTELVDLKRPRTWYYRLASESSKASDDDSESIYSLQDRSTDVVRDTSDTESNLSDNRGDEFDLEFEYEVASLSEGGNDGVDISTTDSEISEGMMLAAAAAVICNSSLEAWVTDVEDSDSSSEETIIGRTDFSTCVQCKGENRNPLYRYCEKCFQDRKKSYPPRPRRNKRRRNKGKQQVAKQEPEHVKLDTLRNCLSGLSQDSGFGLSPDSGSSGSSQEFSALGLDRIVVPEYLQSSGTSKSEDISSPTPSDTTIQPQQNTDSLLKSKISNGKESSLRRKRSSDSESSLSDFEVKKPKLAHKSEITLKLDNTISANVNKTERALSEVSSSSGCLSSVSSESGFYSEKSSGSISLEKSNKLSSEKSDELCMFCNNAPKDSIFLHTNMAHRCCCYPCAKKTLKMIKRCPICNGSVTKVMRIFTS